MYRNILKILCIVPLIPWFGLNSVSACPDQNAQDVISYNISLFVDVRTQYINGTCNIQMNVVNSDTLWLDLEGLQTDSVYASMGRAMLRKVPFEHKNGKIYIP